MYRDHVVQTPQIPDLNRLLPAMLQVSDSGSKQTFCRHTQKSGISEAATAILTLVVITTITVTTVIKFADIADK
jgi:hypothetical protein